MKLGDIRNEYNFIPLDENAVLENPFLQFQKWLQEAIDKQVSEPTAMSISTSVNNKPSSRIVLIKDLDLEGLVFFTDFDSRKAHEIAGNPYASVLFFYPELFRQIRIEGKLKKVSDKIAKEYFNTRPRESKISAIISEQSHKVPNREFLEKKWEIWNKKEDAELTKPKNWGGYKLYPTYFEFWQGRRNRLHDRIIYEKTNAKKWTIKRLAP